MPSAAMCRKQLLSSTKGSLDMEAGNPSHHKVLSTWAEQGGPAALSFPGQQLSKVLAW